MCSIKCGEVCVVTRTQQFGTSKRLTLIMELGDTEETNIEEEIKKAGKDVEDREPVEKPKAIDPCRARNEEERAKEISEAALSPQEKIAKFLRDRSISESLITTLLNVGFSDEFVRLLKAMGFSEEDIAELEQLWNIEAKNREVTDSIRSSSSSDGDYLSPDGIYLRNGLSKPLSWALREIVAKKPSDPIEYLGHWLLNYKVCQERQRRLKELELELRIERDRLKPKEEEVAERESFAEEGYEEEEEEEYLGDLDYPDPI